MTEIKSGAARLAVITVHGTGDTATGPVGSKWFQNSSTFTEKLKQGLGSRGVDAEVIPHLWTGANSANARELGARKLVKLIRQLSRQGRDVHVVGHSHGGNVANDAACMLGWSLRQRKPKLSSVTTVGTPFFRTHVTASERIGAWAFVVMTWLSIILVLLAAAAVFVFGVAAPNLNAREAQIAAMEAELATAKATPGYSEHDLGFMEQKLAGERAGLASDRDITNTLNIAFGFFVTPSIVVLLFTIPIALHGIGRIRRAGRKLRADTALYSIWHPQDEAIAFLMRVEGLPIEPFPRWSFMRSSRTSAIVWAIRAVLTLPLTGLVLAIIGLVANLLGSYPTVAGMEMGALGLVLIIYGLAGGPLIFAGVYLLFRLAVGIILELGLRGTLNRSIGGVLKGLAFGRDGDNRIGNVAPLSHYYAAKKQELEGEVAARMQEASAKATQELFNKYRSSMFAVGISNADVVNKLATDAMTWDSLIHTTYFDQPEVADMIAGHIAENARRPKGRTAS